MTLKKRTGISAAAALLAALAGTAATAQEGLRGPPIVITRNNSEPVAVDDNIIEAREAGEAIQRLDQDIAARRGQLSNEQLSALLSLREFAVDRLRMGQAQALATHTSVQSFPRGDTRWIQSVTRGSHGLIQRYSAGASGGDRVTTRISAPENWSLAYVTFQQSLRGGAGWVPYTYGSPMDVMRYRFRLSGRRNGLAVTCEFDLPVWDDPTQYALNCQ